MMSVIEMAAIAAGVGILVGGGLGGVLVLAANPVEDSTSSMDFVQRILLMFALAMAHVGLAAVMWGMGRSLPATVLFNTGLAAVYMGPLLFVRRRKRFGHLSFRESVPWWKDESDRMDMLNVGMVAAGASLIALAVLL
jgi:hypothetical protein